jgi:hypothetical protein
LGIITFETLDFADRNKLQIEVEIFCLGLPLELFPLSDPSRKSYILGMVLLNGRFGTIIWDL